MTLLECMAAWCAAETLKDTACDYKTALALYRLRAALRPEAECYTARETALAETCGGHVSGGRVQFDTKEDMERYAAEKKTLGAAETAVEWRTVRVPAPEKITAAQLEALDGLIEFI